jgi:hypothetical protein
MHLMHCEHFLTSTATYYDAKQETAYNMNNDLETKVYVALGTIATELRAKFDISPGDLLLYEPAFAFAREDDDDDDDDALPSIVQVAMNALEKAEREENEKVPSTATTTSGCGSRQWKHLMVRDDDDDTDDAQKNALFAWGAQQIRSRLTKTNLALAMKMKDDDAVEAIRRVSLNAFAVKGKRIDPLIGRRKGVHHLDNLIFQDDFDLVHAVMQIGEGTSSAGNGVYLLASAANHSCAPNSYVTFDDANNNIMFRATAFIKAHDAVTISYGPVVCVDGNVHERRSEILASRTHTFVCQCVACLAEEEAMARTTATANDSDAEAMNFIESYITSGKCTAEVALFQSKCATDNIVQSRIFGKAMSDTSIQSIEYDVEIALGFQKLALASLKLRCAAAPMREDTIAIACEIVTLCLLRLFIRDSDSAEQDTTSIMQVSNDVERAKTILSRYYGEDYPYKEILDSFASSVGSTT